MAGIAGLEPTHTRVKVWCLTDLAISQRSKHGIIISQLKSAVKLFITKFLPFLLEIVFGAPSRIRTWDTRIRSPMLYPAELRAHGAGEGNRTLATSLEGWGSTTELHPQRCKRLVGMSGFEPLKAKLTDLQSVPFGQLWNIPIYNFWS